MPCSPVASPSRATSAAADPADRAEDRVEIGQQLLQAGRRQRAGPPSSNRAPKRPINRHLRGHHLGRQDVGGELVEQAAAGHLALVEHRTIVASQQQVPGGGEARRPAADDRHATARGRGLVGQIGSGAPLLRVAARSSSAIAALDPADRHGGIEGLAAAGPFARPMADAAQRRRQGQVLLGDGDGIAKAALADLPQHGRDVHMRRATLGAERDTVAHVVAEQEFHGGAADLLDLGRSATRPPCRRRPARRTTGPSGPCARPSPRRPGTRRTSRSRCRRSRSWGCGSRAGGPTPTPWRPPQPRPLVHRS